MKELEILRHFQTWSCLYKAWSCSQSREEPAEIREREHRRACLQNVLLADMAQAAPQAVGVAVRVVTVTATRDTVTAKDDGL